MTTAPVPATTAPTWQKLLAVEAEMNGLWVDKRYLIRQMILALVAREHMFIVGPPGEAKSAIIRDFCKHVLGATYFEHMLNEGTVMDEVFGPMDVAAYREGRYHRIPEYSYTEADIVFLDELDKAAGWFSNLFLQSMNERIVKIDGKILPCRLLSFFGAANETLDQKKLGAFYDRFLMRCIAERLTGPMLMQYLREAAKGRYETIVHEHSLTLAELHGIQELARPGKVAIPDRIFDLYAEILGMMKTDGLALPSSRRSGKALITLLGASAVLNGRDKATETDLACLVDTLWVDPKSRKKVRAIVMKFANPRLEEAQGYYDEILAAAEDAMAMWHDPKYKNSPSSRAKQVIDSLTKINELGGRIKTLVQATRNAGEDDTEITHLFASATATHEDLKRLLDQPNGANVFRTAP